METFTIFYFCLDTEEIAIITRRDKSATAAERAVLRKWRRDGLIEKGTRYRVAIFRGERPNSEMPEDLFDPAQPYRIAR